MTARPADPAERYQLGPLLGSGGMADVHRATDVVLGRPVAVKVFRLNVEGGELARIVLEARTLARLSHPGLVVVYDGGGFAVEGRGSRPFLVMELVEGPTWPQTTQGAQPVARVARLGAQLADTLSYVHGEGVVHRDIKPANILLTDGDRTKLADFGVALVADAARHTRTGTTIGTAPYLSPEQVLGEEIGPPSDVYSLGLVLVEALTGRREYPGAGAESALARLHRRPSVPDHAPAPLRQVLTAITERDPRDRPTAAQASRLLRAAAEAGPGPEAGRKAEAGPGADAGAGDVRTATRVLAPPVEPAPAGSRTVVAAVAALGVLGVLVAVLLSGGADTPRPPAAEPPPTTRLERDLAELREAVTP